jgi:hypothetical protein
LVFDTAKYLTFAHVGKQKVFVPTYVEMSGASTLQAQKDALKADVRDLELRMKELERVEQTYEKEFLDKKHYPANRGFLYKLGLHSLQDFTIAAFILSYVFFAIVMILYAMMVSTSKFTTFFIMLITMIVIGLLFGLALIRFG